MYGIIPRRVFRRTSAPDVRVIGTYFEGSRNDHQSPFDNGRKRRPRGRTLENDCVTLEGSLCDEILFLREITRYALDRSGQDIEFFRRRLRALKSDTQRLRWTR